MFANEVVRPQTEDADRAAKLQDLGFSPFDALHLACAERAEVDVFLTTDDGLLSRARSCGGASPLVAASRPSTLFGPVILPQPDPAGFTEFAGTSYSTYRLPGFAALYAVGLAGLATHEPPPPPVLSCTIPVACILVNSSWLIHRPTLTQDPAALTVPSAATPSTAPLAPGGPIGITPIR